MCNFVVFAHSALVFPIKQIIVSIINIHLEKLDCNESEPEIPTLDNNYPRERSPKRNSLGSWRRNGIIYQIYYFRPSVEWRREAVRDNL